MTDSSQQNTPIQPEQQDGQQHNGDNGQFSQPTYAVPQPEQGSPSPAQPYVNQPSPGQPYPARSGAALCCPAGRCLFRRGSRSCGGKYGLLGGERVLLRQQ